MKTDRLEGYLEQVDDVIANGTYKDDWSSLSQYPVPEWYLRAKFGIFIHWGVYSVPAFGSEWYPRNMYLQGTPVYEHHVETYGPPSEFGYADFIPLFKAEKFDAAEWARLFKAAGARYVMPVAEHHDGFQLYDSELSDCNAAKMGPERDVVGELRSAIEQEGMVFTASSHRAENFWFFGGGRHFDSGIQDITYQEPYGWADPVYSDPDHSTTHSGTHDICSTPPSKAHLDDWLARCCELVDKYQPKVVWFDWWIQNMAFKPYLKKFAAYYYNRSLEWGVGVAINHKFDAYPLGTAIFDIERGQLSDIRPRLWQTDTAIAKNSWGYTDNNDFKNPVDIVCDMIDIVSKNGCLLLNVGPRADGTINDEERAVLLAIGEWLQANGEAIYDTDHWLIYGEGSTRIEEGAFTDVKRDAFTSDDIRFTYRAPCLYAHVLKWPTDGRVTIESLRAGGRHFLGHIETIDLLGFEHHVSWSRDVAGLHLEVAGTLSTQYPVCARIRID
ncbi:MAG: alpha-L-fucosidase [Gemmatimonadetes bacterium]|jgi:alpha-L-fucosidase|nr:alpha-L-fucosidase [Gemmatimonadota bacterium]MBT6146108.1 alpha-L-fucosidase [Gemmatimonadota bacterium]MBT7862455.1 alpha-L-fucosidase [Gemmatimonadota bacterium]